MSRADSAHDHNVIGAFILATSDLLRDSATASSGASGAASAALVSLAQVQDGKSIKTLSQALRISPSRAVRVSDQLEAAGLAERVAATDDRRAVRMRLTQRGWKAAARVQQARRDSLRSALADLSEADVAHLAALASKVLATCTQGREHAQAICRLCDADDCGEHEGRCPVTAAATAAVAARG